MEIGRKIASRYLEIQYRNAKKYLENVVQNGVNRDVERICSKVRNVGIAYAQTKYCVFLKNGSFVEDMRSTLDVGTNINYLYSLYDDFMKEVDADINKIINKL